MGEKTPVELPEDRRSFFKTVGRTLMIGLTGGTVVYMVKSGKIDTCIQELSPCTTCAVLKQGCELPKAVSHRRQMSDGK